MDKALITQAARELSEREPLELAGQVANRAAVSHVVEEYVSRKAPNTNRTQAAALDLFDDYLDAVADVGAGRGMTWGIVEGFVKWLRNKGYAVATVNNRLSAVKFYARLAMKAGIISADELQLIKAVSGYSGKEAKRVSDKEEHVSLAPDEAWRLKQYEIRFGAGATGC